MVSNVILSSALRSTLNSIDRTQETIDVITQRLASGLKVNSAIDDPQNFFTARALRNVSTDYNRLLDGLGQSLRVIQEAIIGVEAVEALIDQAEAITLESLSFLRSGEEDPAVIETTVNSSPQPLAVQILDSAPDVYYRLNETGGPIVDLGTGAGVTANYTNGASPNAAPLYTNGASPSVQFDGINDHISVADSALINLGVFPERTLELVFNADSVAGRQILYEEGANVNGLTIYIDSGLIRVTGEDDQGAQRWFDADISAPIVAGQTYHVAFVFDGGTTDFIGYLDGVEIGRVDTNGATTFPSHSGDIHIGGSNDNVQFHDGEGGGGPFDFAGRISDVAIYNRALSDTELFNHANSLEATTSLIYPNQNYEQVLEQLDRIVIDANYRGINLLYNETLTTTFNPSGTSTLVTEGQDFSSEGFGLKRINFNDEDDLLEILDQLRDAREEVREFAFTLTTDLSIIQIRSDFTREFINTHDAGADDLTVADANEEGASFLASQVRLDLGITALGLAGQSLSSTLRLF